MCAILSFGMVNPFLPSPHNDIEPPRSILPLSAENSGAVVVVCGVAGAEAMLPYLEITHTESHCHRGLCLIKPNTLWKLFGLDGVISAQVDGRKLTLGTSSQCERVNDGCYYYYMLSYSQIYLALQQIPANSTFEFCL